MVRLLEKICSYETENIIKKVNESNSNYIPTHTFESKEKEVKKAIWEDIRGIDENGKSFCITNYINIFYKGMNIVLNKNKLSVYGLGSINYNDKSHFVLGSLEVDTCIKDLNVGDLDIGVVDTRNIENALSINYGTIKVLTLSSLLGFGLYSLGKYLSK